VADNVSARTTSCVRRRTTIDVVNTSTTRGTAGASTAAPAGTAVQAEGLVKVFGETRAVDGLDLIVPVGSVLGLLGPNGAGKTTTVRILATLLAPDGGSARVFDHDVAREPSAVRGRIGLTGQFASIDDDLTGMENLLLQARLLGLSRAAGAARTAELLDRFELTDAARRQVRTYSGGMQRRLDIATSLVVTPDLLFLDEPTTGLDPRSRNHVWEVIRELVAEGTTVLLTTQYLDEADRLADRIAVVDRGRIVADDTPSRLKSSIGSGVLQVQLADPGQRSHAAQVLTEALQSPVEVDGEPTALRVRMQQTQHAEINDRVAHALVGLAQAGIETTAFTLAQPSLDEVFLALTGHPVDRTAQTKEDVA
jgi:ABC-2 type transport system ATP-binding protein